MPLLPKRGQLGFLTITFVLYTVFSAVPSQGQLRKTKVGDEMPGFSLPYLNVVSDVNDPNKAVFTYKQNREHVLVVAFLSANQEQSKRAAADIEKIIKGFNKEEVQVGFVGVISGQGGDGFAAFGKEGSSAFSMLLDAKYQLWGKVGVIATPTVLVIGKDGKVLWIKAGYGYDFVPSVKQQLGVALGLIEKGNSQELTEVKTLTSDTVTARLRSHLQMAKMLEQKGRLESAIEQVSKARDLDPNSIDAAIELAGLYCKKGKGQLAIEIIADLKPESFLQKSRWNLILGWANRQMNKLDAAEKFLQEATELNPKLTRGFFELGKVYQAKGETEKAMEAYRVTLAQVFGEPIEEPIVEPTEEKPVDKPIEREPNKP